MISAQRCRESAPTPVPTAGNAIERSPFSFAISSERRTDERSESSLVLPPSRMLAAWMT
jgi:hypothetical protein